MDNYRAALPRFSNLCGLCAFAPLRLCAFAPLRQISRPPTIPHCDKNRIPARLGQDRRGLRATLTAHSSLLSLKTALSRFLPPISGQSERQIPHPYGARADDRQRHRARTCQNPRLFLRCDCPRRPVTSPPRRRRESIRGKRHNAPATAMGASRNKTAAGIAFAIQSANAAIISAYDSAMADAAAASRRTAKAASAKPTAENTTADAPKTPFRSAAASCPRMKNRVVVVADSDLAPFAAGHADCDAQLSHGDYHVPAGGVVGYVERAGRQRVFAA